MRNLGDLLRHYNCADVVPLHRAIGRMIDMYASIGIGVFHYLTLPSLAYDYAIRRCRSRFWSTPGYLQEWHHLLTENVLGGFASPLCQRRVVVGETKISPDVYGAAALVCRALKVLDFNSLYPACLRGLLPCGLPQVRVYPDFRLVTRATRLENSREGILYARWLSHVKGVHVAHAGNGQEVTIGGKYKVDAYVPSTGDGKKNNLRFKRFKKNEMVPVHAK